MLGPTIYFYIFNQPITYRHISLSKIVCTSICSRTILLTITSDDKQTVAANMNSYDQLSGVFKENSGTGQLLSSCSATSYA